MQDQSVLKKAQMMVEAKDVYLGSMKARPTEVKRAERKDAERVVHLVSEKAKMTERQMESCSVVTKVGSSAVKTAVMMVG